MKSKAHAHAILSSVVAVCSVVVGLLFAASMLPRSVLPVVESKSSNPMIASARRAGSVIVVGNHASASDRFVAGELQRYIATLSGATLATVTADEVVGQPKDLSLLLIGGPESNEDRKSVV